MAPNRGCIIRGSLAPAMVTLGPEPSSGWYRLVHAHRPRAHRPRALSRGLSHLRSQSVVDCPPVGDRPPTPASSYRRIGFGLPRNTLLAELDDGKYGGLPLYCPACQAAEAGVEAASSATTPAEPSIRRVRFVDPVDTCGICKGYLIHPCGLDTSDVETLVNSGDDDDDDDYGDDNGDHYYAVTARYPPLEWELEDHEAEYELSLDFNLTLSGIVGNRALVAHANSVMEKLGPVPGMSGQPSDEDSAPATEPARTESLPRRLGRRFLAVVPISQPGR